MGYVFVSIFLSFTILAASDDTSSDDELRDVIPKHPTTRIETAAPDVQSANGLPSSNPLIFNGRRGQIVFPASTDAIHLFEQQLSAVTKVIRTPPPVDLFPGSAGGHSAMADAQRRIPISSPQAEGTLTPQKNHNTHFTLLDQHPGSSGASSSGTPGTSRGTKHVRFSVPSDSLEVTDVDDGGAASTETERTADGTGRRFDNGETWVDEQDVAPIDDTAVQEPLTQEPRFESGLANSQRVAFFANILATLAVPITSYNIYLASDTYLRICLGAACACNLFHVLSASGYILSDVNKMQILRAIMFGSAFFETAASGAAYYLHHDCTDPFYIVPGGLYSLALMMLFVQACCC